METKTKPQPREPDGWLQTYTRKKFLPLDPQVEDIDIQDIAHALSNMCRFGGHINEFYSVAQHSVFCSLIVPKDQAFAALMHDATEAYLVDVPRPIKRHLNNYNELEDQLAKAICKKFDISPDAFKSKEVKVADNLALVTEAAQLLDINPRRDWGYDFDPLETKLNPIPPKEAKAQFLARYYELTK